MEERSDWKEKISAWLAENGFEEGSFMNNYSSIGCPPGIRVKPEYSPIDGSYTILVTPTTVQPFVCDKPWAYNAWRPLAEFHTYSSKEELKTILDKLVKRPLGCWG